MKPITSFKPIVLLSILSGMILTIIGCIAPITLPDTSEADTEKEVRERMAEDNRLVIGIVSDDLLEQLLPIVMPANATPMAMPANAQGEANATDEQQTISGISEAVTWTLYQPLIIEADNVQTAINGLTFTIEDDQAVVTLPDHLDAATVTARIGQWCYNCATPTPTPISLAQPIGIPTKCSPQIPPKSRGSDQLLFNLPDEGESYAMPLIFDQIQTDTTSTIDEAFKLINEDSRFADAGPYVAYEMDEGKFTFLRNSQNETGIQLPYAQIDIVTVTADSFNDPSLAFDLLYDPQQMLSQTNDILTAKSVEEFLKRYQDALCPDPERCAPSPTGGDPCVKEEVQP